MQIGRRDFLKHTGMIGLGAGVGAVLSPSMARAASAPSANPDVVICGGPLLHQMAGKTSRPAGAPRVSDVSIRFFSIRQEVSAERMFEAGRAYA